MPFPTTSVLDNFNRADGGIGSNWTSPSNSWEVVSNKARQNSGEWVYWNATNFGNDQEVFVTLDTLQTSNDETDILLKIHTDPNTYCIEVIYYHNTGIIQVWRNNNGTWVKAAQICLCHSRMATSLEYPVMPVALWKYSRMGLPREPGIVLATLTITRVAILDCG